jgi:hypothetical protein
LRVLLVVLLAVGAAVAQPAKKETAVRRSPEAVAQPDAMRTRGELGQLLQRYPPTLRNVLGADPQLVSNQSFVDSYPALAAFLEQHPEVARNPAFYVGTSERSRLENDPGYQASQMWRNVMEPIGILGGFSLAVGFVVWLIRTLVDYKRWSRLARVQTEAHTKLLDRFTANDELLAYVKSPAGSRFLESAPISLDGAPRSVGAPMGRILWSIQGGVVLIAAGIGFGMIRTPEVAGNSSPVQALSVLAIAVGIGFLVSAAISFVLSRKLGLIEPRANAERSELPQS